MRGGRLWSEQRDAPRRTSGLDRVHEEHNVTMYIKKHQGYLAFSCLRIRILAPSLVFTFWSLSTYPGRCCLGFGQSSSGRHCRSSLERVLGKPVQYGVSVERRGIIVRCGLPFFPEALGLTSMNHSGPSHKMAREQEVCDTLFDSILVSAIAANQLSTLNPSLHEQSVKVLHRLCWCAISVY